MSNPYPLPGETVVRTLRNQSFGEYGGYDADEPAPPEIAACFRECKNWEQLKELAWTSFERTDEWIAFEAYQAAARPWYRLHHDLLRLMGRHLYKSYICDGHRIRLRIEPDVCRKKSLWIEVMR